MKTVKFKSMDEYEAWTETYEEPSEYQRIPSIIDNGFGMMMDMFTECKSWKTALRRFEKAFASYDPAIVTWIEGMKEAAGEGYFEDRLKPGYWITTKEERAEFFKGGSFSWGIEETSEGLWYIYLNISGVYADREYEAA